MAMVPEIIRPGPGQESVWDYPRPPSLEAVAAEIIVIFAGETIAKTSAAFRVLETSHPPVYYIPPQDVRLEFIVPASGQSYCEYKGVASYFSIVAHARRSEQAGWRYVEPSKSYHAITGYLAFYASRVDEARVGSEIVKPQPGDFYGGWVTSNIVGPFKGAVGTKHW